MMNQLSPIKQAFVALEEMRARLEAEQRSHREPVAVIGIGCRLPGGAHNPDAFWNLLTSGLSAIGEVPKDRWNVDAYYHPDPEEPGKMVSRWGGFLEEVSGFDPAFFSISPREAARMDPQHRTVLEVVWEALEDAALPPAKLWGTRAGTYIGISSSDYANLTLASGDVSLLDAHYASGIAHSTASGRISYILGLQGPSISIDTACSSSLVAVHLACQGLRTGDCSLALAGGVNVMLAPETMIALSRSRMLSPEDHVKAFDAAADGFVRGEGCGVVVLKRLSDAVLWAIPEA